ncbi:MAG: hypothetical protein AMXMBFR84_16020 [Candidatus Hydrogenedentota bacterium]
MAAVGSNRVFYAALGFSLLFHFSMVTVFSIEVWLPVQRAEYFDFEIVPVPEISVKTDVLAEQDAIVQVPELNTNLSLSTPESAITGDVELAATLPTIQLPSLQSSDLNITIDPLGLSPDYTNSDTRRRDSWELVITELAEVGDVLKRMTPWDSQEITSVPQPVRIPPLQSSDEATVRIEWMTDPLERKVLFAPTIDVAGLGNSALLSDSISLVFRADSGGRVTEVLTPVQEDSAVQVSAGQALLEFRFEPIGSGASAQQYGILIIEKAAGGVLP